MLLTALVCLLVILTHNWTVNHYVYPIKSHISICVCSTQRYNSAPVILNSNYVTTKHIHVIDHEFTEHASSLMYTKYSVAKPHAITTSNYLHVTFVFQNNYDGVYQRVSSMIRHRRKFMLR